MNTPLELALGPELTVAHAADARQRLLAAIQQGHGVALDLSAVTDFDSAGVQLLLATRRHQAERGQPLVLRRASEPVRDALATFGLGDILPIES